MNWSSLVDVIGVVGSLLSLLGVIIALVQIRKTLAAARAAAVAAKDTQLAIARSVLLTDVSACVRSVEEVKVLVRVEKHEAALMRVTDLSTMLIQLQSLHAQQAANERVDFTKMLSQLAVMRESLEQRVNNQEAEINPVKVNTQLSNISDQLNRMLGKEKYMIGR